jgi:hypothetical protein
MKIAISGTHSTGKSTALNLVRAYLEQAGYKVRLVSDLAVKCPLPILRDHTSESSLWIAVTGVSAEIECQASADVVLVDRPVIDAWGYLKAASKTPDPNSSAYRSLESPIRDWMPSYDVVFSTRLDPFIPIQSAKGRDLDEAYRAEVASNIREAYVHFGVKTEDVTSESAKELSIRVGAFLHSPKK